MIGNSAFVSLVPLLVFDEERGGGGGVEGEKERGGCKQTGKDRT